jgi:RNA polymerase sigma-70 factor (ECF subfamily)
MKDDIGPIDAHLIRQAQSGDVKAFGQLYERYASAIFRYVHARVGDHKDAEDIAEEVFIKAWRSLPRYEERGYRYSAFLFKLAQNLVVQFFRKAKRMDALRMTEINTRTETRISMEGQSERQELYLAMSKLPENYRRVLELRFFGELSSEEIAQVMERSPGAIRVMQNRALTALRQVLKGYHERERC